MQVLNEKEVAKRLSVSIPTLRNWRHQGRGPAYLKIGSRKVGYLPEDCDRFAMSGRVVPVCSDERQ